MKSCRRWLAVGLCAFMLTPPLHARQTAIRPALDDDPAVLARLAALPAGHGAVLGEARLVGDFNDTARRFNLHQTGPRGRDYSLKMAWAPQRGRALFAGANHGQPHRLNDVWEFDLGALSWVLLYPPDLPRDNAQLGKDASDVVVRDGVVQTRRGGPAILGHTWWGLTWDAARERLLWMNVWVTKPEKLIEQLGGDPDTRYKGLPLWSFDPQRGQWTLLRSEGPAPRSMFGGLLEYIEPLGGSVWHANNWQSRGTWVFASQQNTWRNLAANAESGDFNRQAPGAEQVGYYDPQRKLLVVQRGRATFHFDVASAQWTRVRDEGKESDAVPNGHDAHSAFVHDPVSGEGLFVDLRNGALWAYQPASHDWRRLTVQGEALPDGRRRLVYFDADHGVLTVIDGRRVWAYRHAAR